ncbi:MAG TPA: HAD family hydrolase [Campylobacterales bacterium]|nr:HAD family hydrolase [Campylobacterales bacterium]
MSKAQKALFLDRDGVINIDYGYVYEIEKFEFTEGIFELLKLFIHQDYQLFIVTNQSGIGRGYYGEDDFQSLTSWMIKEFQQRGIDRVSVEHCPHQPDALCSCRKPRTGMVEKITSKYAIDLTNSWLIGDKQSDIDLANNAGIAHTIAVGDTLINEATYSFKTIQEVQLFLEENKAIIAS